MLARRARPTYAEIDLDAYRYNLAVLTAVAGNAELCAVVKADGYGHGAVPVAKAALAAGVPRLAVALVEEAVQLRQAGIGVPLLILSQPALDAFDEVAAAGVTPTLYTMEGVAAAARAVRAARLATPLDVHVKVDTGMHRVGVSGTELADLVGAVVAAPELRLEGVFTHFAQADEPDCGFTETQLARFQEALGVVAANGGRPTLVHAANSAGLIAFPESRFDLVRCGIASYGYPPSRHLAGRLPLRHVLSLHTRVSYLKTVEPGDAMSYGQRYAVPERRVIATLPIGYADGVPRRLGAVGAEVLINGRRRRIAGTVTMDQITVDCGPPGTVDVRLGDPVVLIGRQGEAAVGADDWADLVDTISYEILCGISSRVPRQYSGGRADGRWSRQEVVADS